MLQAAELKTTEAALISYLHANFTEDIIFIGVSLTNGFLESTVFLRWRRYIHVELGNLQRRRDQVHNEAFEDDNWY